MKTKTKAKTKPTPRARRMWVDPEPYALPGEYANVFSREKCFPSDVQVAVIPLDDVPALVEKAKTAYVDGCHMHVTVGDRVTYMLTAIGVLPKKGRK